MRFRYKILLGFVGGVFICDVMQAQDVSLISPPDMLGDTLLSRFAPGKRMF